MIRVYRRIGAGGAVAVAFVLSRVVAVGATHAGARVMTDAKRAQWVWTPGRSDLHVLPEPPAFLAPLIRWDAPFYLALVRRADGVRAALLFSFSPGAAFLSYPYSEALFAAAFALALWALCKKWLPLAALGGALASATRSPGVAAAVAIASFAPAKAARWLWALVSLAGLLAFMEYCRMLPMATGTLQGLVRYQGTNLPLLCGAAALVRGRRFWVVLGGCCAWMALEAFLYGKGVGLR